MAKYEHIVTPEEYGMSINTILRLNYRFSSRFRTKIKYQHLIDLNGVPAPGYIKPEAGDVIGVRLPVETNDFPAEDIPLDIIHEDDDLLIINKQPGIIVHPTKGHPEHTIANGVMKYMADKGEDFKIRFANRIDMDTSGLIVVAKNSNAQNDLASQMRRCTVVKRYIALAEGIIDEDHFEIDLPVGRPDQISIRRTVMYEGGKDALSEVRVLERFPGSGFSDGNGNGNGSADSSDCGDGVSGYTLVEVTLHTGRTHQIRVHLSHIGHPIAGDSLYGGHDELISRQALHAHYIEFDHPFTHERVSFEAPVYQDMVDALNALRASDSKK